MKLWIQIPLLLLFVIAVLAFSCNQSNENNTTESESTGVEPVNQQKKKTSDKTVLVGDWERRDAPYQLKISELFDGGMLKAGYFNPKSINVGKALWTSADGVLNIYFELKDENYPGSNYNLTYVSEKDLFAGEY
jgi:hypothetical protein